MTPRLPRLRFDPREEHNVVMPAITGLLLVASLFVASQIALGSEKPPAGEQAAVMQAEQRAGGAEAPAAQLVEAPATLVEVAPAAVSAPEQAPLIETGVQPLRPPPTIDARTYAVIDRSCGAFLYGKDEHERIAPASTTKIITALVVDEMVHPDEMVDINGVSGSQMMKRGSSIMGVEPGMRFSVRDLLFGLMLPSGNDAALALAQHIGGGDVARFTDLMNEQAAALGMRDTHFSNPHGLDSPELYSSAIDMARAGRAYLDVPFLADIGTTASYRAGGANGILLKNGNRLLQTYPGLTGVKIGYTTKAQQTIVAAAQKDGREIVISVMGSADRYTAATQLFDWAFANLPDGACAR